MSGIVRAVHQSSSKLGDTPLARLDLFESLPSRGFAVEPLQQTLQQNRALHRSTTQAPARHAPDVELCPSTALDYSQNSSLEKKRQSPTPHSSLKRRQRRATLAQLRCTALLLSAAVRHARGDGKTRGNSQAPPARRSGSLTARIFRTGGSTCHERGAAAASTSGRFLLAVLALSPFISRLNRRLITVV